MKVDHDDRSAAGRLPDAMDPGFHGARTHWIRVSWRSGWSGAPGPCA